VKQSEPEATPAAAPAVRAASDSTIEDLKATIQTLIEQANNTKMASYAINA
jgi:hypothetical protein